MSGPLSSTDTDLTNSQLISSLLTPTEGRGDQEQPEQEAQGATERRVGHLSQPPPLRAEHPQQAGPPLHPQAICQLPQDQELLPRSVFQLL
ncbi:unnamed protein product [Nezara viridula]|uniref:Uncharacterized protein n=1 Tax=Nezara viridula TaxID=85310 RepID=A0A9P0MQM0_NEZVI|nr:unnamed protein product [Nezara viridula]